MACSLNLPVWTPVPSLFTGKLVKNQAGDILLHLEDVESGLIDSLTQVFEDNALAIQFLPGEVPVFQYARSDWGGRCKPEDLVHVYVDLYSSVGGFSLRNDGKAVGVTTTDENEVRIFYIDLKNYPVVLTLQSGVVLLRFPPSEASYFQTNVL